MIRSLCFAFAGLLAAVPAQAQVQPQQAPHTVAAIQGPIAQAVDARLSEAAAQRGFSGAVVIERDGALLLEAGYGHADREARTPYTADTIGQIGSITKTFTALAVSRLAAQGKLDLDAAVGRYLPQTAEPARSRKLRDLPTHQSGLADYCGDDFQPLDRPGLLSRCAALPLGAEVGKHSYSNMGYSLLAAVVEQIAGEPWDRRLARTVWEPWAMTATGWTFSGRRRADFAVGYQQGQPMGVISDRIAALNGADWHLRGNGGIQASANDMRRFMHGLLSEPAAVRALMLEPQAPREDRIAEGFGLVLRLGPDGKPYRAGHSGSDGVFFSYLAWYPAQKTMVYFVGSNGEKDVVPELQAVMKIVQDGIGATPPAP